VLETTTQLLEITTRGQLVGGLQTGGWQSMVASAAFWLAPLLLSVPLFSRDTYSYLAQGALLRDGLDPYTVAPVDNPNPLLDNVSPIWTITTAPYGPAFIMIARLITMLVGNHVIAGTMLLRLCMLPGLALLIWATPRIARHIGANVPIALWICALNPLVIIHLMGGVHNEMLMVGLMMAGIALTFTNHPVAGASLIGCVAILGAMTAAGAVLVKRTRSAILATALTVAVCNWVFVLLVLPDFERFKPVRSMCEVIGSEAGPEALVGYYRTAYPSMVFYLRRPIFEYYHQDEIEAALISGKEVFCLITEAEYEALRARMPVQTRVLASHPIFQVKLNGILDRVELPRVLLISNKGGTNGTQ